MKSLPMDFFIDIFLLLLSIFLVSVSSGYPAMARHFPQLVLVTIIAVTVLDLINRIRNNLRPQEIDKDREKVSGANRRRLRVVYMVMLMFVFFAFLVLFGLPIGVFGFLLFSAWSLGYKRMMVLILSSLAFTGFVYLIFEVIMQSMLPNGVILDWLGG